MISKRQTNSNLSNAKICSVSKVWNPPQHNLPARKRIIRTRHGTTLLRNRFFFTNTTKQERVTKCNEILTLQFIHSCLDGESQQFYIVL